MLLTNNLEICGKVGSGAYGIVYKVKDINTGKLYALKAISKVTNNRNYNSGLNGKPSVELEKKINAIFKRYNGNLTRVLKELNLETIKQIGHNYHYLKEISIHLQVNKHPNVVTIHKVFNYNEYLFILMDYYSNGDLFGTIVDKKIFIENPSLIKRIFLQLVNAIQYCHDLKIYHCDIKPENILINDDYSKIAITDFGLAVQTDYVSDTLCCGSSYYMAPERLLSSAYQHHNYYPTGAGDIWSLGIILINLTCIRNPWMKAALTDETFEIYLNKPEILYKILPISKELFIILSNYFLVKNPYKRGTNNLEIIRKLIINCKSFTKDGPLSKCEIFKEKSLPKAFLPPSPISATTTKRSYEDESTEELSNKRLSPNNSHSSSYSSLISFSEDDSSDELTRNSSTCTTCSSNTPLTISVKCHHDTYCPKSTGVVDNNTIKNENDESLIILPSLDHLIDYEFSFDAGKQYHSTTSLFNHKE